MHLLKKLSIFVLLPLLFTACKKEKFESTGTLVINYKSGFPTWYILYTEAAYSTSHLPLISVPSGPSASGFNIKVSGNTMTIEGLNYGTYVLSTSSSGINEVQVAAGTSKTYEF